MMQDSSLNDIKLIIGIGNPGEEYARTLHNAGKMFVEWRSSDIDANMRINTNLRIKNSPDSHAFADSHRGEWKTPNKKHFCYIRRDGPTLITTTTFMNESGASVKEALVFFKAKPEEILVVHDESDLALGTYTYSFARGAAGHHGIESIVRVLGNSNFWRLRIGIRPETGGRRKKAEEFVLKNVSAANLKKLQEAFVQATEEMPWLKQN
ncbi:MAG: aminoacyl-tRNA hydrolase [bacterium]|nr:aminoacyl-tRNA hydrolase [bacterium]